MRERTRVFIFMVLMALYTVSAAVAKDKTGPLTGTWDCQAHGTQGDLEFTLTLQQNKETVTGNTTSPIGDAQISSGTFKHKMLEIHINTSRNSYILLGKLDKGKLSGSWTAGDHKGNWEGKKHEGT